MNSLNQEIAAAVAGVVAVFLSRLVAKYLPDAKDKQATDDVP